MSFTNKFNSLLGVEDSYQAPDKLMEILFDREKRERLFRDMLEMQDYDVSYDWFHKYFQDEHADRKKKKQDFTPNEVGELLSKIAGDDTDNYYEVAVGTGGILIQHWQNTRMQYSPFNYSPMDHLHIVEELSDRVVPFLLFNIMIRGMNAIVIHGETLSRNCKGVFFIQNFENNHLGFSDLNVMPYTKQVEEMLGVRFRWVTSSNDQTEISKTIESTRGYYPNHVERSWYDEEFQEEVAKMLSEIDRQKECDKKLQEAPEELRDFLKYFNF